MNENYLEHTLALTTDSDTDAVYANNTINAISSVQLGAILQNLVDDQPNGDSLTHPGGEVIRFARDQHGSVTATLKVRHVNW